MAVRNTDTSPYTFPYRIQAAAWFYESDRSDKAMRHVKEKLRANYEDAEPPRGSQIKTWMEKLFTTGSLLDTRRGGRPSERGDMADEVDESVQLNPRLSIRKRSEQLGIGKSTLHTVIKKDLGYKPFKSVKVQYLAHDDLELRIQCCQNILNRYDNARRQQQLFFSDECAIYGDGKNMNSYFWSKQNPHFWEQIQQHPPSVMIWAAMSGDHLIGPFFIAKSITADVYLEMLRTQFIPALQHLRLLYSAHFQQDGAPAHTAIVTRRYLNDVFPDRWVGKFGPIAWPPRSPDLTSCDNALWGLLKPQIISQKCQTINHLKDVITTAFQRIDHGTLQKIHKRTFRRFQLCIDHNGQQVDPFDN